MSLDEIIPNLWIGDIVSALDEAKLRERNIHSVVTAMRGKVSLHETFTQMQLDLDDTEEEDVLPHLVTAISFIQSELEKGRGVLVHCHAGISRSATIVAAYLMFAQGLDAKGALELIRKSRPNVEPNTNFLAQLDIFHQASFKVSRRDKATRMYYLDRIMKDVMNGDGCVDANMFAKYPPTPTASAPPSPGRPQRRIRCKMCRQGLATREHMLHHGQPGTPSPASGVSPAATPRSPEGGELSNPLDTVTPVLARHSSFHESLTRQESGLKTASTPLSFASLTLNDAAHLGQGLSENFELAESGVESKIPLYEPVKGEASASNIPAPQPHLEQANKSGAPSTEPSVSPANRALPLPNAPPAALSGFHAPYSPPILADPACSGYFVEPMKWMEPFLAQGQLAGKIVCPNTRCGAKLGNYDWAGVRCSCKEWVVPGFCIHRSKVDEVV